MEIKNNSVVAFTGHRKERILQGCGNNFQILGQIRDAVVNQVIELYGQGYNVFYTGERVRHDRGGSRLAGKREIWGYRACRRHTFQEASLVVRRGRPAVV